MDASSSGIIPSMGAISSPWDSAVTESLMSTTKMECTDETTFKTKDNARLTVFIETFLQSDMDTFGSWMREPR